MEVLALIPARGGSKGLPRKNIRLLAGRPLIAYSIETARRATRVNRVVVSTDDAEIAEIARREGAEVPFSRPAELAQDTSRDLEVFRHALLWLEEKESYRPEAVVHFRPTCPVRRAPLIDQAIELFGRTPEADSLRSVSISELTPYKMWRIVDGCLQPLLRIEGMAEPYNEPRQILPRTYWQNGYVDITRVRTVLEKNSMNGGKILAFPIEEEFVDIDYEESLRQAEALLLRLGEGKGPFRRERHSS